MPLNQLSVGPQNVSGTNGGQPITARSGQQGDTIISHLHGRYYEQNYRGYVFGGGISNTALAAANAIATGVTATALPVIGVWNPLASGVNLVILKAIVQTS